MKDYKKLKQEAILLRKKGLSYNEIKKELPVSKSTLSLWLKSIPLRAEDKARLYTKQIEILSRGPNSQKERRAREVEKIIEKAMGEIKKPLSFETHQLMGAALYWGEGSKGKKFEITNSDPNLILFFIDWIQKILGIPSHLLRARLNIYPQQSDLMIKKFWSELTRIPLTNFGKSYVKPLSSGFKKNNLYYGTIRIEVPRGTDIRYRTYGWIKAVLQEIEKNTDFTEKRWASLRNTNRPVNLK